MMVPRLLPFVLARDETPSEAHFANNDLQTPQRPVSDVPHEAVERAFLARFWREIELLPPLQRLVYVLHCSNGEMELFWFYGIASLRQIGRALQLTSEQFQRAWILLEWNAAKREQARVLTSYDEKFAMLWPQLPLNDLTLAALLETTQQNVRALRFAARRQLSRRMNA